MSVIATAATDLPWRVKPVGKRGSRVLFASVAMAHGVLIALLLQSTVNVPVVDFVDGLHKSGSGNRLQVHLLVAPALASPSDVEPPPLARLHVVPVAELANPTVQLPFDEPGPQERLAGLYLGQLRARIGRTWETLHAVPAPPLPDCGVELTQDSRGGLLEVSIQDCPLDGPTRALLARAIHAAAPLPAPPAALPVQTRIALRLVAED